MGWNGPQRENMKISTFHSELRRGSVFAIIIFYRAAIAPLVNKLDIVNGKTQKISILGTVHPLCDCKCSSIMIPYNIRKWLPIKGAVELRQITSAHSDIAHFQSQGWTPTRVLHTLHKRASSA